MGKTGEEVLDTQEKSDDFERTEAFSQLEIDAAIYESNKEVMRRTPINTESKAGTLGKTVSIGVNGTTINCRENDKINVPTIHLFPGVTLDMGASLLAVSRMDEAGNVTLTQEGNGPRLVISVGGMIQVIQVSARNVVIKGQNGKPDAKVEGLLDGYLAFILSDYSSIYAKGERFTNDYVASDLDGERASLDGKTSKIGQIMVIKEGVYANSRKIDDLTIGAGEQEESGNTASSDSGSDDNPKPESSNTIDFSGDVAEAAKKTAKAIVNGDIGKKDFKGSLEKEVVNVGEEETHETVSEAVKEGAKDQLKNAGKEGAKALLKGENVLKAAGGSLATTAKMATSSAKEDIDKMVESLKSLGCLPQPVLDKIQAAFTKLDGAADQAVELTDAAESVKEAELEAKEAEEKELKFTLTILPGLLSLNFSAQPHAELTGGVDFNISKDKLDENKRLLEFALSVMGSMGLTLTGDIELGNCLLALTAAVSVDGSLVGGMGGNKKFLSVKGIKIEAIRTKEGFSAALSDSARLELAVELKFALGGSISVGSEIIGWQKELVSGQVEAPAASLTLSADIKKVGHFMSLDGWQLENADITTAIFDSAKTRASEMQFAEVNNIAGVNDFLESSVDRTQRVNALDTLLNKIKSKITGANAMVFSKDDDAFNKSLANQFVLLKRAYDAVIGLSEGDIIKIDHQISSYENESKKEVDAIEDALKKRADRKKLLEDWESKHKKALDKNTISKDDLLKFYKKQGGAGGGFSRYDKEQRRTQATNEIYSKKNLMDYENKRIEDKQKVHQARHKDVGALIKELKITKNTEPNEEFLSRYISLRGSGKGFVNHLLRKGVSSNVFKEEELRQRLVSYEKNRLNEKLKEKNKVDVVFENYKEADQNAVNVSFNKDIRSADKEIWQDFVISSISVDEILHYEKERSGQKAWTEHGKNLNKELDSIRKSKESYERASDETERAKTLGDAKAAFLAVLDDGEKEMLRSDSNAYMMMSAKQIKEKINNLGDLNYYIKNVDKKRGQDIKTLKKSNKAPDIDAVMKKADNQEIYTKYLDYLLQSKKFGTAVFDLGDMIAYELGRKDAVKRKARKAKHDERANFLTFEWNRIKQLEDIERMGGYDENENSETEMKKALSMYFTGERPADYATTNQSAVKKIKDKENYSVEKAEGYIDYLKKRTPSKEAMIEALEWDASNDEEFLKFSRGKEEVGDSETMSAPALFDEWQDAVDPELRIKFWANRVAVSGMNSGLKAADPKDYTFDGMIAFLQFMIGNQKHINRVEALENKKAERVTEPDLKKHYIEKLEGGNRIAEIMAISGNQRFTPANFKAFYTSKATTEKINSRNGKHNDRIKHIEGEADFGKLIEWYTVSENASRFEEELLKDSEVRKKITPAVILAYEANKASIGSTRHQARKKAIEESDSDESARDAYQKMFNGGAGFMKTRKAQTKARAEAILTERSTRQQLEQIYAYESVRTNKWLELKAKYQKPIDELTNRKTELSTMIASSKEKIVGIDSDLQVLKEGTADIKAAKAAITDAGKKVGKAKENEAQITALENKEKENTEYIKENEKSLKDIMKEIEDGVAELERLEKELEELEAQG